MSFGNFSDEDEVMSEINMTPLVDVMLVLLIIFMITMPVLTHAVKMDLPQAASQPEEDMATSVMLDIAADGSYRLDDVALGAAELEARLAAVAASQPQPAVHVRADRQVAYDAVAQALAAAQRTGLTRIGFVTVP
ncbi:MAG: ExbD/TolR family protein [Gammaproteobacteria bacterium]